MKKPTDWTVGSPTTVSGRISKAKVSARKCRLYCVACCRASQQEIKEKLCLELLEAVEAWVENPDLEEEVARLRRAVAKWSRKIHQGARSHEDWLARWSVWCAADRKIVPPAYGFLQPVTFRPLLREIMGTTLAQRTCLEEWRTGTVLSVARGIYQDRAFDHLPVLSDALLDAGCTDEEIIAHCRTDTPHVRGCWVIDLLLGLQ